jgi:predicted MFS family arabinose efflux permease
MAADALSYAVSVASLLAIRASEEPASASEEPASARTRPISVGEEPASARTEPIRTGEEPASADTEPISAGEEPIEPARHGLRAEIAEGLSFVFRDPILRKIAACTGTANLFGGMATALEIIFLIRVLHVRPADTGLLIAVASLGGVAGGIWSGRLARRIGSARIIWFSLLVLGLPMLLVPLAEPGWRVAAFAVGMAAFSFSAVVYNVAQVSYRQAICPPQLLGRMNAAIRWVVWGTIPLGGLLGGAFGAALGVRATMWIGFAGCWAAGWWVFFSPLRVMRDVPQEQ